MPSKEEIEDMKENLKNLYKMLGKKPSISTNAIRKSLEYIKELEKENIDLQKSVEQIFDDYQDIGKKAFEYSDKIEQLKTEKQKLIEKLEDRLKELNNKSGGNIFHVQQIINAEIGENERILKILRGENDE